jgi:hypothetical protein|tara:strand:+ start:526 stop:1857 length:1332 start_codon:yes stop_codon:yes gene_type:complete
MKRRSFIKKSSLASAAISVPLILPSGRLFAASGMRMSDHVVLVAFAGGVRQQESILQRYLDDSQSYPSSGNLLYNIFNGAAPTDKIVYGTKNIIDGDTPIPKILSQSIESQGTTFREVNASAVGHYAGVNAMLTGNYMYTQGLRNKPMMPTIFEYLRRHQGEKATKTWFIGNGIGNSIPLLDYSTHSEYGASYGANFLAPTITFGADGEKHLKNAKVYHPEDELDPMYKMKYFLDNVWYSQGQSLPNIGNTEEEKAEIKSFVKDMFEKTDAGTIAHPPISDNGDLRTIGYACEVMKRFKPTLTVIYLSSVDGCHSNFTSYLESLHRADHGVGHVWDYIQNNIPSMANNTTMMVVPEHGRNLDSNNIVDGNAFTGFDHSDSNSRRIFSSIVGPGIDSNLSIGNENNQVGDIVNLTPTIAEILGCKSDVINSGLLASNKSLFDFI